MGVHRLYHRDTEFRLSPYCHSCCVKLDWWVLADTDRWLLNISLSENISKDGEPHLCWQPCLKHEIVVEEQQ